MYNNQREELYGACKEQWLWDYVFLHGVVLAGLALFFQDEITTRKK